MLIMSAHRLAILAFALITAYATLSTPTLAEECSDCPSWMFARSTFSHSPESGARLAQYARHDFVEELPDPRMVTSGYRTTRTNLRGANGSLDTYYQVQSWANGRGGLDAEWERFHDAWKESYLTGSYFYTPGNDYGRYPRRGYGYGYGGGYGGGYHPNHGYRYRP